MSAIVTTTDSAHWYLPDGTPYYEVPNKSKPGTTRKTTLRDARKANAVPSVTTILSVINKPPLTRWLCEQWAMAAATTPRTQEMSDDEWIVGVREAAEEASSHAANLGSRVHLAIEQYLTCGQYDGGEDVHAIMPHFEAWWAVNKVGGANLEHSFAGYGYGGKTDLHTTEVVWDFKTQGTRNGKVNAYSTWGMQLAAYCRGLNLPTSTKLVNVVISTTEIGLVKTVEWANYGELIAAFDSAYNLWAFDKGYDPRRSV